MNALEVARRMEPLGPQLRKLGVKNLSLFGSVSRSCGSQNSDLDFLVEFEGFATYDRYMGLLELLQKSFGRKIDLVTRRALKPVMRDEVLQEAVRVA